MIGPSAEDQQLLRRAGALREAGRAAEAAAAYRAVLSRHPQLANTWFNLGLSLRHAGAPHEALRAYAEALRWNVSGPEEAHLNRAVILSDDLDQPDAAEAELNRALSINPTYAPALLNLGNLHEDRGRRSAARAAYERALSLDPSDAKALARLANCTTLDAPDLPTLIDRLRQALNRSADTEARAELAFALGRLLDAVARYDEAFDTFAIANAESRRASSAAYDRAGAATFVDRMIEAFPPGAPAADTKDPGVIFICGLFRSGSTLVERILSGHDALRAGGELNILPRLTQTFSPWPDAARVATAQDFARLADTYQSQVQALRPGRGDLMDKRPDNFLNIGLIMSLFPEARIVHTVRDPRDVCLSNWMLHLDPSMPQALDLDDMAHWHQQYERLMAYWKSRWPDAIIDVSYDRLVSHPTDETRRLLDFLDLPWSEDLLDFSQREGSVRTASVWQVREPLYRSSSGRWSNYAGRLSRDWLNSLSATI